MGQSTFIRTNTAPRPSQAVHTSGLQMDMPLLLAVITLIAIGLLFVLSSSVWYTTMILKGAVTPMDLTLGQLRWAIVGIVAAFLLSRIDYHFYQKVLLLIVLGMIISLGLVLIIHDEHNGAARTLFNGSVQPSELAALAIIIYLSFWLNSKREVVNQISFGLFPLLAVLAIIAGLILAQPDLSAAITIVLLGGLMFFLAGGQIRQIILVVVVTAALGVLLVSASSTWSRRLTEYVGGFQDPQNAGYHVQRSIEAVVRGGIFGVGIGKSETKFTGLPVAWTDSIFAVITEETGLLGAVVVLGLYGIILWRGMRIAARSPDLVGRLMATGITFWIVFQAWINIGVLVNLLPFTGNALPFISLGGSNLVTTLLGVGILMNIHRSSQPVQAPVPAAQAVPSEGRSFGAVIDLRRRDRRRRVSRPDRPAGSEE